MERDDADRTRPSRIEHGRADQLLEFWISQRENFVWDYGDRLNWETDPVIAKVMSMPEGDPAARLAWLSNHGSFAKSKLLAGLKTNSDFESAFNQYRGFVVPAARVAGLREPDEFEIALKDLVDEQGNAEKLGACEFINESELRRNHLKLKRVEVMMAMFQQALNICRDGFEQAAAVTDPFNRLPLVIEKSDTGFNLKSNIPGREGTLEMRFPIVEH